MSASYETCPDCDGDGYYDCEYCEGNGCRECDGLGQEKCGYCGGVGFLGPMDDGWEDDDE